MTTFNRSDGTMPNLSSDIGNGTDGKFEIIDGYKREKWNPYARTKTEHSGTVYLYLNRYPFWMDVRAGVSALNFNNDDTLKLLAKSVSKVRAHDFHLGKFIGEGRQTVSLVKDTILNVGGALVDLKHRRFEQAARRLGVSKHRSALSVNDIAGRWLELQFGWKPLLQDAYEACKAFEKLTSPPASIRYQVGTSRTVRYEGSTSPTSYNGLGSAKLSQKLILEVTESLSQQRSLGLYDPAGIAWELLPYSFVIDWFIPVGTYLDVLNTIPHLSGRYLKTQVVRAICRGRVIPNTSQSKFYVGCESYYDYLRIVRTTGSIESISIPLPTIKPVDKALSSAHIYNAIALIKQRLK